MTETPDPTQTPALTDRLALEADVADEAGTTWLADLLREAAVTIQQGASARRTFLERAVCHPGPPMSETGDYDPDADLSELEGSVLERMDMETRWHRELMEIRREAEGILVRTPDPSRSTVQVFKDLLAHFVSFHRHLEERVTAANEQVDSTKHSALRSIGQGQTRESVLQRDLDRWRGWAPAWISWPYAPTEASKAMDCDGLRLELAEKIERSHNMVAMLRRRCERYEGWWSLPVAQRHPLGPEFSDDAGSSRPDLAEIEQIITNALAKRYPNGGHHEETLPLVERVRREIERGLATLPSREPAGPELPVRTPVPSAKQGLFRKYKVCRWDGMCDPADSEYFVLRLPAASGSPEQRALAAYADTVESTHPQLAGDMRDRYQLHGPVAVDNGQRDAVAEHIRAAGGDPENATVAQIADALNATNYFGGGVTVPNAAADGLEHTPDQRGVAVKLQWDSPDTFEVAPPKRITIDLRRPATPPTPAEEVENAVYMARMMEGVKQAGAARPEWPLMPLEIVMQIGFATFKPEATSVIWAGQVISTGDADLSLQMENPVHELSVFNFEDSMGRVRKQSGKGRLWLALDDAAAERLGFYCGAGLDGPVSLTLLWPSSDAMRFEVRLHGDALDDDEGMPKTRAGDGKAWHGYQIEVCPYPGPAADLFQARNRP